LNFDDIVNNVNDEWILKELFMQYRLIIYGGIDTSKLRKRPLRERFQKIISKKSDEGQEKNKDY